MDRQLREWAAEQRLESAPVRVELLLRRELRARRWKRRMAWAAPLAAAAALAVFFWPRPEPAALVEPIAVVAKQVAEPVPEPVMDTVPLIENAKPAPAAVRRVSPPRGPAPQPFVAVGAWQAVEPIERASIVRAELPRATLARYGMPVGAGRLTEPATVELLLGEDGTLRAIRLVSSMQ
jgi:hypothetical protein